MRRWKGLKKLVHDAVDHTTDIVEETNEAVADKTFRYIDLLGPVAAPARLVNQVRRMTAAGVFATIHGVNRAVEAVTDEGIGLVERAVGEGGGEAATEGAPLPMRSDATRSLPGLGDVALGAVNGVLGDYLHERGNELDAGMLLRHGDRYLSLGEGPLPEEAIPRATSKVAVFVHGLVLTEASWCFGAERYHGDPEASFGSLLARDLGFTPLFVRYNTGRHISENGRLLAERLEELLRVYPVPVEELVLVGHSMGGLVSRSACHLAEEQGLSWLRPLSRVVCLASPHRGAPFEKLGNAVTSALRLFDTAGTQIPARVIDARSVGIKDLRFGYLRDEDWLGEDPDAFLKDTHHEVPLLDDVAYCFVGVTVTESAEHPVGQVLGDMLVRLPSATAPAAHRESFEVETHHFGGVNHLEIQNHPDVYEQVRRFCAGEIEGAASRQSAVDHS